MMPLSTETVPSRSEVVNPFADVNPLEDQNTQVGADETLVADETLAGRDGTLVGAPDEGFDAATELGLADALDFDNVNILQLPGKSREEP